MEANSRLEPLVFSGHGARPSPEGREAGQRPPAVRRPRLLLGGLRAGRSPGRGASLQGLGPFLADLGLQFRHQLVEVLAAAHHLPSLVDGVDLRTQGRPP